jgi:hypothetical protein
MTKNTPRPAAHEGDVPIAYSRIVIGHRFSFIYIVYCPLCGLEHLHGQYSLYGPYNDPAEAFESCDGHRGSHCGPHGLGRIMRRIGGEWCNEHRDPPPEYHEPKGESYAGDGLPRMFHAARGQEQSSAPPNGCAR